MSESRAINYVIRLVRFVEVDIGEVFCTQRGNDFLNRNSDFSCRVCVLIEGPSQDEMVMVCEEAGAWKWFSGVRGVKTVERSRIGLFDSHEVQYW